MRDDVSTNGAPAPMQDVKRSSAVGALSFATIADLLPLMRVR
jgi:hypothetical protein